MEKKFEYEVRRYPTEQFVRLAYFCTAEGECGLDELLSDQMAAFEALLNERGTEGWELVQAFFGKDAVVMLWKRET